MIILRLVSFVSFAAFFIALEPLRAAETVAVSESVAAQESSAIRKIFDFDLTKIIRRESIRLSISPSWRDVIGGDVVRIRTRVRYGFSNRVEGFVEAVPFFDNFGAGATPTGIDFAEFRVGGKYAWPETQERAYSAAVGFSVSQPSPNTPESLALDSARFQPYIVFSKPLKWRQGLSAYLNLGLEIFDSDPSNVAAYRPAHDNVVLTPGIALHRAPWNYSFSLPVRTSALFGHDEYFVSFIPAVTYTIPQRFTAKFRGQWTAGLAYEGILYDEGMEHRVTGRLTWDIDWVKAIKERFPWPKK